MARFTDDTINCIKQDISLLRIVESQGHQPKRQGKDYAVCCPFHEDKTPSCIISPASNLFNCFGCGAGGSVIDWVMKTQGVSFRHAVELLKNDHLTLVADTSTPVKQNTVPKLDAPISENGEDQSTLKQVIEYYHQTLLKEPEAQAYLAKRGLDDAELIKYFRLGYANRTLGLRLPHKNRKAGAAMREQLQRIGLYRDTGREHFNGSLVIPVMDDQGIIGEVYGRKIQSRLSKGIPKHTYLSGPHCGVLNVHGLKHVEEVILCESLIDALTFWRWGFRHVTSSYGTNGFTDEILEALTNRNNKIKRVLIAYDRDESGNKAALEVAEKLNQHGIDCFRILFPKGMDANEYACKMSPPQKSLALVIRKAEWMGQGKAPERQLEFIEMATESPAPIKNDEDTSHPTHQPLSLAASLELEKAAEQKNDSPTESTKSTVNAALNHQTKNVETSTLSHPAESKVASKPGSAPEITAESAPVKTLNTSATPSPKSPTANVEVKRGENELFITLGGEAGTESPFGSGTEPRVYRVRGLESNTNHDQLKIQLLVRQGEQFHMDKLDLTGSKQRQVFINQAGVELGLNADVIKKDLGKVLLTLEDQQAEQGLETAQLKPTELKAEDRKAALELLSSPDLLPRILTDFNLAGVVGEDTNKLTGYLACVSRKLSKPLAILIQSTSAAGKSSLMDAILAFMPEEERTQFSAMTGQSLFYMGETQLKHKILAISEEEGASNASYALKLLQSEGEVTIASTGKDDSTGNLVTKEYKVEGPVMLFLTTTAIDIDEELLNRCLVLTVNESREQTQAIHAAQRAKRTLLGLQNKLEKERIISLHRNAQRLLKPLAVINPYADQLTFLDDKTRTRRDHEKYLTLIDSIALLHQYQRETKTIRHAENTLEYIEVTLGDIEMANQLAHEILGRTLDELPPQTRKLLKEIQAMVQKQSQAQCVNQSHFRFSRKSVREFTQWSDGQLKIHCKRLEEMEYLLVHRGGRGLSIEYELLYTGNAEADKAQLMGLLDVEKLKGGKSGAGKDRKSKDEYGYDPQKLGQSQQKAGPSQAQVSPKSEFEKSLQSTNAMAYRESSQSYPENALEAV